MNQYLISSLSFFSVVSILILSSSSVNAQPQQQATKSFIAQQPTTPSTTEDFFNRGVEKFQKRDYQGAIEDFNQALRLNPNNANAYQNRGTAWIELENYQIEELPIFP
jgi:Flp pilus assembly protein TadD